MADYYGITDHIIRSYKCARCGNSFEAQRSLASTCPICGYSCSENLSSEADIVKEK